ncbi:MAG TPA: YbhN family protein, partial [Streptosporangiaceae bacterium]|nr:YbhN family protein [Streptosporangiaceae bacterium]
MSAATPPDGGAGPGPAGPPGPGSGPGRPRVRRHRWVRTVLVLLAVGVIVTVVVLDRHALGQSVSALGSLDLRWFLVAIACELVSLVAFGLSRRRLLRAGGDQARFSSVMAITYAGNALSMSIPFAGAQLAVVFSYQQFRRRGLDPAVTGWALGVSAIASSSALAIVLVVGAFVGGAPVANAVGFLGAAVFALPAITVILALRYPRARAIANRVIAWALGVVRRIIRKPGIDPDALDEFLQQLASIRLRWPQYGEVFALAVVNWLADCACLACAIKATGEPVPWAGLLLAYGAGAVAGSTGVTPGGFLIVEAALTAALAATGMAPARALAAVLAYRLVNFWMILFGGGIVFIVLTRKRDSKIRPYPRTNGDASPDGEAASGHASQPTADH